MKPETGPEGILGERLRFQAISCARIGSPLYARLLGRAAADVEAHGPTWKVLRGHEQDPGPSALALRLMGAVNRLVLAGEEPELAAIYDDGGSGDTAAWPAFSEVLARRCETLRRLVDLPVQTNEVGRCAALLPDFLTVAAETGLPLRLLEVGASAGLNLHWDRYRYAAGAFSWGPGASPVTVAFELDGERAFPLRPGSRSPTAAAAMRPRSTPGPRRGEFPRWHTSGPTRPLGSSERGQRSRSPPQCRCRSRPRVLRHGSNAGWPNQPSASQLSSTTRSSCST